MTTPSLLHRFAPDGRYLGVIVVDRPIEQYAARTDLTEVEPPPDQAGFRRCWSGTAWQLVPDTPPEPALEQLKAQKWREMKLARAAAIGAPLITPWGTFDADDEARNNIVHTAQLMQTAAQSLVPGSAPTADFTLYDNSVVTLTAGQMVQVALLLADQIQTAYARGRQVRAAIEATSTAEEVLAITWSTS